MSTRALARPYTAPPRTRRRQPNQFRADIEGLRAVAVLLVVAFHAGVSFVSGGFVGVDVFFVLSGFLITGLLVDELARTGTISIRDFYARRIRRLLPLSTLVLAATAIATFLLVPPIDRKGIAGDLVGAALWGANWRYAVQSTQYMADTDKSPVLHYWSLSVEEQFYVVWPLLLLVLVGSSGVALRAWPVVLRRIGLALTVVTGLSLWLSWRQTSGGSPFAYFGLHTRAWELGVGAGLALLRPVLPLLTRRAAQAAAACGVVLVVGSALVMDEATPFPGTAALLPVLGTALLVAAGARLPDGTVARVLGHAVPRYIGRVSYAWYLWHWPVLVLAKLHWGPAAGPADGAAATHASWQVVLAAVAVSFALAVISHYAVEQPLRQARRFRAADGRALRLGGALIGVSLASSCALMVGASASAEQEPSVSGQPGPVTPAEARDDRPRDGDDCYVAYDSAAVPPAEHCRFGPEHGAKRTIALVGDSHAAQWRPAVERAAKEHGWTVYFFAKSSCTVSDVPVWLKQNKAPYDSCGRWRDAVLDRLAGIKGLDAVVIGRWMDYRTLALQPDGSQSTAQDIGPLWTEASKRSFAAIARATKRIVVIKDVPRPTSDVPSCLSQHSDDVDLCAFDRAAGTGLDTALVRAEKAAAPAAVRFVDLTDVICPADRCQVVTAGGQIMYRDSHHLTEGYSEALWKPMAQRLEAAIG